MYGKGPMRVQYESCNSPFKHSPSYIVERYVLASTSLEAIKILGIILSHVSFTAFPITLSSSAKICRKSQLTKDEAVHYIHAQSNLLVVVVLERDTV